MLGSDYYEEEEEVEEGGWLQKNKTPGWVKDVGEHILRNIIFGDRNTNGCPLKMSSVEYETLRISLLKADPEFWKLLLKAEVESMDYRQPNIHPSEQLIYKEDFFIVPALMVLFDGQSLQGFFPGIEPLTTKTYAKICNLLSKRSVFPNYEPIDILSAMKSTEAWVYKARRLQGVVAIVDMTVVYIQGGAKMKLMTVKDFELRALAFQLFEESLDDMDCFRGSEFYKDYLAGDKTLGAYRCRHCKWREHYVNATILAQFGFEDTTFHHVNVECVGGYDPCGAKVPNSYQGAFSLLAAVEFEAKHGDMTKRFQILYTGRMTAENSQMQVDACFAINDLLRRHFLRPGYICPLGKCACKYSIPTGAETAFRTTSKRSIDSSIGGVLINCGPSVLHVDPTIRFACAKHCEGFKKIVVFSSDQPVLPIFTGCPTQDRPKEEEGCPPSPKREKRNGPERLVPASIKNWHGEEMS